MKYSKRNDSCGSRWNATSGRVLDAGEARRRPEVAVHLLSRVVLFFALCATATLHAESKAASPSGEVEIVVSLGANGVPRYRVLHRGKAVVLDSRLGFDTANSKSLLDTFSLVTTRTSNHRGTWSPPYGERTTIPDNFTELVVVLEHQATGLHMDVIVRAYDEGAALRYSLFSTAGAGSFVLSAERTEFHFPENTFGYEEHGTEGEYARMPIAAIKKDCERPLTVEFADGRFACLLEAAQIGYPRMLLSPSPFTPGALVSALSGPATIDLGLGFVTPWRVFIVGDKPGDLLERNHLVLNLNAPSAIVDTSWIQPGKAIRETTLSTPGGKACVDFAVAHGFRYVLYDAGWYGPENDEKADARGVHLDPARVGKNPNHPGLDLAEVIAYGRARGIGIFLYVNRRALERQLDELFPLYEKWGVAGVKFGFVQVGKQEWTTWLINAVRKAAEHHLMVDVHDSYRPTGIQRTYPNLLTQEGVRGNEHMPTATHNATLPFTRLPAGPADYTICVYSNRLKTTRTHQLALAVTGYSPFQCIYWYDRPAQFDGAPELAFFDRVPTTWDDTKVLDGKIGEFATIARRSGEDWFIGSITGDAPRGRELTIPLTFLAAGTKYTAHIYENAVADPQATRIRTETVDARSVLRAKLPAAGGQAVWLTKLP